MKTLNPKIIQCKGIYCGKRLNSNTGGGFRFRPALKFAKLDYIPHREKGFCSEKCQIETER